MGKDATCKVIINDANVHADTVAGSLAKEIKDYVGTIPKSSQIWFAFGTPLGSGKVQVIICHEP